MAEEVEMTPVDAAEPPKADPLAKPPMAAPAAAVAPKPTLKLPPKPGATVALKPGLRLPPKPGGATVALKPGLKLPTQPTALKSGLKLPTQTALKPGVKLPPKPVIRKPGATVVAAPLPKPVVPQSAGSDSASAATPAADPKVPAAAPVAPVAPVAVDAQGVGKLPTVQATAIGRADAQVPVANDQKAMETLKSVTQKLKGITQEIPQQAILRKTGIIADAAMSEAQKEASKHKTARISLSDAMGVAPVKNEAAPMKTIRIKRPIDIPGAATPGATATPAAPAPSAAGEPVATAKTDSAAAEPSASVTQRKTLKIARPGGAVRPSGKFGIKRPSQATTVVAKPAGESADVEKAPAESEAVADIPDIPNMPMAPVAVPSVASDGPAWLWSLSSLIQIAACVAMGALAWFLYQNSITNYF